MKVPKDMRPLRDDGDIDEVVRPLKSGKEATVCVVRPGTHFRCAKLYRDMARRSFQRRAQCREDRKVGGSCATRAMSRNTRFGRKEREHQWKSAEVDALSRLMAAGVRVPWPIACFNDVLIMALVTNPSGNPAPRLCEMALAPVAARGLRGFLMRRIVRMPCLGLVYGDLAEFNVLPGAQRPVIIDLPQVVNAAFAIPERDVNGIRSALGRFVPELLQIEFARQEAIRRRLGWNQHPGYPT